MMWWRRQAVRPIIDWMDGQGDALEAWRAAVEVPRELTLQIGWQPFLLIGVPVSIFATIEADLPPYNAFIIFAGAAVAVAYAAVLHFFAYEQFLRPVLEDIVDELPADFTGAPRGRAAALEAARRAAADQRDHRRGGERAVDGRQRHAAATSGSTWWWRCWWRSRSRSS